jgi:hypothetical protein
MTAYSITVTQAAAAREAAAWLTVGMFSSTASISARMAFFPSSSSVPCTWHQSVKQWPRDSPIGDKRPYVHRRERRSPNNRGVVARELVHVQELPDWPATKSQGQVNGPPTREACVSHLTLHLHKLQQLLVLDHVALVQEHHQARDAHLSSSTSSVKVVHSFNAACRHPRSYLLGQEDVLAGLGHGAIRGRYHQDTTCIATDTSLQPPAAVERSDNRSTPPHRPSAQRP